MRVFEVPCPDCSGAIEERHKPGMIEMGRWCPTRPKIKGHAGFRLNALVPQLANASWGKLAIEFVAVKDDPSLLQTFVNTILGQGWREEGEELDDAELANRREGFSLDLVPADVLVMTAGVDVQRDKVGGEILWESHLLKFTTFHRKFKHCTAIH